MTDIPAPFDQQIETFDFLKHSDICFDMSDPGTGKTRAHLMAFVDRLNHHQGKKALVLAPKSILQPAWGNDIDKFFPGLRYSIAYATNRESAFRDEADVYITNHDAIKWITSKDCPLPKRYWDGFDSLIIDESTAFKHHTSARSKAAKNASKMFQYREAMSGTPNPNSVTELHHQALLLDNGERLGTSFWKFRQVVQTPEQVGPQPQHIKWVDKDGSEEAVFDLLRDITIRHKLTGVPGNHTYPVIFDLPTKVRRQYQEMLETAITMTNEGKIITAVHAASLNQKLLQIASGAVYTGTDSEYAALDDGRAELVMDLVDARRDPCVIVFQWRHQREALMTAAKKRGFPMDYIDGTVHSDRKRAQIVEDLQAGKLRGIIVHPQSAGHGLTLTRAKTTIFVSPTYNAEHYKQVFHRIVRATQTSETETIHVVARGTIDELVYERLDGKLSSMQILLELAERNKQVYL